MSELKDVETLQLLLKNLVTNPDAVFIQKQEDEMGTLLKVQVDAKDMGIVIGRSGIMAQSIKTIMRAIGKTSGKSIQVQFLEPDGSLKYSQEETSNQSISVDPNAAKILDEDLHEFMN